MARRTIRRRTTPRRKSGGGGGLKPVIDGLIAGMGGQLASRWIGIYGHPAASIVVGMFRHNSTLKTEGARELGAALASQLPIIGGTSPYGGAY
jgi:hypothetical protein